MALKTLHFVPGLSRTPFLFFPRYLTNIFPKHILQKEKVSRIGNMKISKVDPGKLVDSFSPRAGPVRLNMTTMHRTNIAMRQATSAVPKTMLNNLFPCKQINTSTSLRRPSAWIQQHRQTLYSTLPLSKLNWIWYRTLSNKVVARHMPTVIVLHSLPTQIWQVQLGRPPLKSKVSSSA